MSMVTTTSASNSPLRVARVIASDIKLAHSVFAMPFALLAAFMAALGWTRGAFFIEGVQPDPNRYAHPYLHPIYAHEFWPGFAEQLVLIVLAMVFARTVAMLSNRILDQRFDRSNPRTVGRAIPSGRLSQGAARTALIICAIGFVCACVLFGARFDNWWPTYLAVPVLAWITAYPLVKRVSLMCHVYLGASLALSPVAAAIAIQPACVDPLSPYLQPALWLLAGMVLCWVAGFDIIYALQDVDVDRAQRLHSIPSRLGVHKALWIARLLHAFALACLIACLVLDPRLGLLFGIGVGVVAILLVYEHLTVARWGTSKIALAFFTLNGVISCLLGALGIADVLW
jgi:4-hydroxybenzoate polyprenyltransferase